MDIKGKVVFITGASSGIGAATARAASKAGARLVLLARREAKIRQLAVELDDAIAIRCDVTNVGEVTEAVRLVRDTLGRIDVLVNNAGQGLQASIEEIDPEDFSAILRLNVVAPLITMRAIIPLMKQQKGGSIVNIGSGITFSPLPNTGAYSASKAGLSMLSSVARVEVADAGIAVSTLYPFITATDFVKSLRAGSEAAARMEAQFASLSQTPQQVAEKVLYLVRSGAERADLVPEKFGGTFKG